MTALHAPIPEKAQVLTKALCQLAKSYQLTGKEIRLITGISEANFSRMNQGKRLISLESKEAEMVLLLLRVYRSLNALVGNHHDKAQAWLKSNNQYFKAAPLDTMKSISGLVLVLQYLDAMRGKC